MSLFASFHPFPCPFEFLRDIKWAYVEGTYTICQNNYKSQFEIKFQYSSCGCDLYPECYDFVAA